MKKKFRVVKNFKIVKRSCSLNRYYRVIIQLIINSLLKEQLLQSTSIPIKFCGALSVAPSITARYNNITPIVMTTELFTLCTTSSAGPGRNSWIHVTHCYCRLPCYACFVCNSNRLKKLVCPAYALRLLISLCHLPWIEKIAIATTPMSMGSSNQP